ncbi:MAG: ATP-binding cassette domain-containing protein [Pirellulaceae bacterium]
MTAIDYDRVSRATSVSVTMRFGNAKARTVRVRDLQYYFGDGELRKQVLFDNNLDIFRGEIVIMTGPSGSGKTTLLTLIGTLRTVMEGSLEVLGSELRGANSSELVKVRRKVGFIFQAHNLFESLTAQQNVRMGMELFGSTGKEMNARAAETLDRLGLAHRVHYKPGSLSGGQKQRVAIARALAPKPQLILADEPTAALDEKSGREVVTLFQELARSQGVTILMVTHDNRILDVADRIVNMVDGHIKSDVLVQESSTIVEFLQKCHAFDGLSPTTMADIADKMLAEYQRHGTEIIRQGDPGEKFYSIRHGSVDVLVDDKVVSTLGEGDYFGEAALLTGKPRNATVIAKEDTLLYSLGKEDFHTVVRASASLKEELQRALFARQ